MIKSQKAEDAALNNAVWCDTVCRTHACPGEFREGVWINTGRVPPFYPNAVTLVGAEDAEGHRERILKLIQAEVPPGAAVKDSFHSLGLASLGFALLFEARWIYRPAEMPAPEAHLPDVRWEAITTASALAAWEAAWGGQPGVPAIFLPALLVDKEVLVIAAYRGSRIVAGAVANRSGTVVGVSNIFTPAEEAAGFLRRCIAQVMAGFPRLPLVGYERGEELTAMRAIGFEEVGPLGVWQRASEAEELPVSNRHGLQS